MSTELLFLNDAYLRSARAEVTRVDDVRVALETEDVIPGPVGPERCPGWRIS